MEEEAVVRGYRIVFIDVDGVLNAYGLAKPAFDPEAVARFARLLRETGATPVLSTAWRLKRQARQRVLAQLLGQGAPMPLGCTPRLRGPARGNEVLAWLRLNTLNVYQLAEDREYRFLETPGEFEQDDYLLPARIHCAQFCVIDDRDFATAWHGGAERALLVHGHFVHTRATRGLTERDAERARAILSAEHGYCRRCERALVAPVHRDAHGRLFCTGKCARRGES